MRDAEGAKIPVVGTITKTGQYLEAAGPLNWTIQKPTVTGLYWYRRSPNVRAYIVEVELAEGRLTVDNKNIDHCKGPASTIDGEWAGPLLSPKYCRGRNVLRLYAENSITLTRVSCQATAGD